MKLISEPQISVKISKMRQRVRWLNTNILSRGIDQTSLVIDDGQDNQADFSFIVIGDTGTSVNYGDHPQRKVAEMMLKHRDKCRFILHTGDVVYTVGSSEYYHKNFISPYREFIHGGGNPELLKNMKYNEMVFNIPFLPVPGNHDYYDVPWMYRLLTGSTLKLRQILGYKNIEIGWHGSNQGDAYARAFLDYLQAIASLPDLEHHLDQHYTAKSNFGRCLRYQPGKFTRLPNRYYSFRYGGIDFFALDSNTFNQPLPLPATEGGKNQRHRLQQRRQYIQKQEIEILSHCEKLNPHQPEDARQLDYLSAKLDQINEIKIDIEKQLQSQGNNIIDFEQLDWLRNRLIESWHCQGVRGRILYFHHPPYVTEVTKWNQAQTLAVRHRIREVLQQVKESLGFLVENRPVVDLIFNGHAHCLEYLRTVDTGYGDSHINCVVAGGSGHYPRRQRPEGGELLETFTEIVGNPRRKVAESLLFVGRNSPNTPECIPYSCVRVDVKDGYPPKFIVTPLVAERSGKEWLNHEMPPLLM